MFLDPRVEPVAVPELEPRLHPRVVVARGLVVGADRDAHGAVLSALEAVDGADAVVLVTEWPEFGELDWTGEVKARMGFA